MYLLPTQHHFSPNNFTPNHFCSQPWSWVESKRNLNLIKSLKYLYYFLPSNLLNTFTMVENLMKHSQFYERKQYKYFSFFIRFELRFDSTQDQVWEQKWLGVKWRWENFILCREQMQQVPKNIFLRVAVGDSDAKLVWVT